MDKAEGERKASVEDSGHQLSFSSAVLMYIAVSHRLPPGEEHGLQSNRFIKLHPSLRRSNIIHGWKVALKGWPETTKQKSNILILLFNTFWSQDILSAGAASRPHNLTPGLRLAHVP